MASFVNEAGARRSLRNMRISAILNEEPSDAQPPSLAHPSPAPSTPATYASLPVNNFIHSPAKTAYRSSSPLSDMDSDRLADLQQSFEEPPNRQAPESTEDTMAARTRRVRKRPVKYGEDEDTIAAFMASDETTQHHEDAMDVDECRKEAAAQPQLEPAAMGSLPTRRAVLRRKASTPTTDRVTTGRVTKPRAASVTKSRAASVTKSRAVSVTKSRAASRRTSISIASQHAATPNLASPPATPVNFLENVDPELVALSDMLTAREEIPKKQSPRGQPPVWADTRQALCETLPYYYSQWSGICSKDDHVFATLMDGKPSCREFMSTDLVIARAPGAMGGGREPVQIRDHDWNHAFTRGALNNMRLQNPVILVAGSDNEGAQARFPHRYCVLDWYKIVDVWQEKVPSNKQQTKISIRYRLERLAATKPAWHAPLVDPIAEAARSHKLHLYSQACSSCNKVWKQLYLEGWMCLNGACQAFWMIRGMDAPADGLHYNPAYLFDRTPWAQERPPYPLKIPLPESKSLGDHVVHINTRGIVCPDCGRCNPRYLFRGWVCDNPDCSWPGLFPNEPPLPRKLVYSPWDQTGDGPGMHQNKQSDSTQIEIRYVAGFKLVIYSWEGIDGRLVHATANEIINKEPGGPDDMFAQMQTEDLGLRRRHFAGQRRAGKFAIAAHDRHEGEEDTEEMEEIKDNETKVDGADGVAKGQPDLRDLMGSFTMNFGMPYKFVASGLSKSFEEGPDVVRQARSRLDWAANAFLGPPKPASETLSPDQTMADAPKMDDGETINVARRKAPDPRTEFNECLVLGYYEGQKINYHDDGEEGLGPRIATLSLGGKARMSLRLKAKHWSGVSNMGHLTPDKPVPLCAGDYNARLAAWNEFVSLSGDRKAQTARGKELAAELKKNTKATAYAPAVVQLTLSHGDIVLMEGYDLQKYLEHEVEPIGHLRFALTCRDVLEGHLQEHEKPSYAVGPDPIRYAGPPSFAAGEEQ